MKNRIWNIPLFFGFLISMVLLFWPFACWSTASGVILRIIPAACVQLLLCRNAQHKLTVLFPLLLTGVGALWGLYLFHTSPDWTCSFGEYFADYATPAVSCSIVCWLYRIFA